MRLDCAGLRSSSCRNQSLLVSLAAGLSIDGLPDEVLHKATELLRTQFEGKSREFVQQHLNDWMLRALDAYWPQDEPEYYTDAWRARLELRRKLA